MTVHLTAISRHQLAPKDMTLAPAMLLPRPLPRLDRFPFNHPSIRYHYLGRYANLALLRALGLGGKEMLFPSYFEPQILSTALAAGVRPRFYPVRDGMTVDVEELVAALTPDTRAIFLIHYVGFPAPIGETMKLARERDLIVIEDCAHALLSDLDGEPLGSFGNGAIFSFYKWAPVPNGGALVCRGPVVREPEEGRRPTRASGIALPAFSLLDHVAFHGGVPGRALRSCTRAGGRWVNHLAHLRYVGTGGEQLDESLFGLAMSPIGHRILRAQRFDEIAARRRRNYQLLADLLADIAPPVHGALPQGVTPLFYPAEVEGKREVLAKLARRGVEGRNFWEPHHPLAPPGLFPDADRMRQRILELPIHQDLEAEAIGAMANEVRAVLTGQAATRRRREVA
jgi:dTDP-4-amino-4,6-dideoxygalactose transaminase